MSSHCSHMGLVAESSVIELAGDGSFVDAGGDGRTEIAATPQLGFPSESPAYFTFILRDLPCIRHSDWPCHTFSRDSKQF